MWLGLAIVRALTGAVVDPGKPPEGGTPSVCLRGLGKSVSALPNGDDRIGVTELGLVFHARGDVLNQSPLSVA